MATPLLTLECLVDRDSERSLALQAVELIQKALDADATRTTLLEEQKDLHNRSPPHTSLWLFYSVIVTELEISGYLTSVGQLLQYL
ncbi:hypothetical protein QR685DRAFT_432962 [Neurospora intermedia]|uniref:Uncharacterized protein n=1 Tax=Neurospora intermedia TaxID=5142 RepID=A0ABR3DSW1_NEUIN